MIKKIISQEEREKIDTRNKRLIGIVLGIIMLFSTAGYFVFDFSQAKTEKIKFSGIEFTKNGYNLWEFSYGGYTYMTIFNPDQTKNISVVMTKKITDYTNQPLYISGLPIEDVSASAEAEIMKNIDALVARSNPACIEQNCNQNYPLKDCSKDNILVFKQSATNFSSITQDQNCVILTYAFGEDEKLADAFLFSILGFR